MSRTMRIQLWAGVIGAAVILGTGGAALRHANKQFDAWVNTIKPRNVTEPPDLVVQTQTTHHRKRMPFS